MDTSREARSKRGNTKSHAGFAFVGSSIAHLRTQASPNAINCPPVRPHTSLRTRVSVVRISGMRNTPAARAKPCSASVCARISMRLRAYGREKYACATRSERKKLFSIARISCVMAINMRFGTSLKCCNKRGSTPAKKRKV